MKRNILENGDRQRIAYHFIRNGFDSAKTKAWFLREYRDHDQVTNAKYPGKLAVAIFTMGQGGYQQQLNISAFHRALEQFQAESSSAEMRRLEQEVRDFSSREVGYNRQINELNQTIHQLNDEIKTQQRQSIALLNG